MAPTELIVASGAAVIVPTLAAPLLAKVPGGAVGQVVAGAALIYGGTKVGHGMAKAAMIGTGAGLAISALAAMVLKPAATATQ